MENNSVNSAPSVCWNDMHFSDMRLLYICILFLRPVKERRRILEQNMKEVPNHIMFSEIKEIHVST